MGGVRGYVRPLLLSSVSRRTMSSEELVTMIGVVTCVAAWTGPKMAAAPDIPSMTVTASKWWEENAEAFQCECCRVDTRDCGRARINRVSRFYFSCPNRENTTECQLVSMAYLLQRFTDERAYMLSTQRSLNLGSMFRGRVVYSAMFRNLAVNLNNLMNFND